MLALLFLACAAEVRVEGTVVDAAGAPVAGARVLVGELGRATLYYTTPEDMFLGLPGVAEADAKRFSARLETDARGRFAAGGLEAGRYTVLAADPERGIAFATRPVSDGGVLELRLPLAPAARVEGDVTGLDFDSTVHVLELKPRRSTANVAMIPRLTQEHGRWRFASAALPDVREWRLVGTRVVLEQDYRATLFGLPLDLAPGERRKVEVALAGGAAVAGRVVDAGGAPMRGVSVVAASRSEPRRELGAVSDELGRFSIRGLSPGEWRLEANRWTLRELPGCGNGPLELSGWRDVAVGEAGAKEVELRVERLPPAPAVGDLAREFEAPRLDGRTLKLSELRGKHVLLDFWATWCGMCRADLPRLLAAYERHAPGGKLEIVGVSVDQDVELVRQFLATRGMAWPQTALGPSASNPLARLYNVHSTPSTVLIGPDGTILALNLTGAELARELDARLAR
jgi:peroxiredoxin